MSRKPTDMPDKPPLTWHPIADDFPRQVAVLTTTRPNSEHPGVPAIWYSRRRQEAGKWKPFADWVDPDTRVSLDPQPTHWRASPSRSRLEVTAA